MKTEKDVVAPQVAVITTYDDTGDHKVSMMHMATLGFHWIDMEYTASHSELMVRKITFMMYNGRACCIVVWLLYLHNTNAFRRIYMKWCMIMHPWLQGLHASRQWPEDGSMKAITCVGFQGCVLTFIPASIGNNMPRKVSDEIIYPFPNFNGVVVEIWECNIFPHFIMDVISHPCWSLMDASK